jgi:membrane-bound lytic murein transglycosylase D
MDWRLTICLMMFALLISCGTKQSVQPTVAATASGGVQQSPPEPTAEPQEPVEPPSAEPVTPDEPTESLQRVEEPEPKSYEHLYQRLDRGRREFRIGLEFVVAGDQEEGEGKMELALADLQEAAQECAGSPGCDIAQFTNVYTRLLEEQSYELRNQLSRVEEFESATETAEDPDREPGTAPFTSTMPEISRIESMLRGKNLRDIINLNGPIRAALDDWLTWMRPLLMESYENYQYLRPKMAPIYDEAGFPEALLFAIMAAETGGKVHAYSRAGAAGPLQFMSYTARRYGLGTDKGFDMRLDPEAATRANVAYLNDQLAALNDSLEKALAAYNGGENRMRGLNRRLKGINFWDSKMYHRLPLETREYVPRVLAAAWLFMHPDDYGLQFPDYLNNSTTIRVEEDISISELSICLGQEKPHSRGWFRTLRNLNPRLGPGERVKAGEEIEIPSILTSVYREKCTSGLLIERARLMHDANYPDVITYVVVRGDSLGKIASKFRCASVRQIAAMNNIRGPRYLIRVGQRLRIPQCK